MVFPAYVLVEKGRQIPGVVILGELVEDEIVRKGLHIHPVLIAVKLGVMIKGIQRFFKVGKVLLNGVRHLLGQRAGSGVLDVDVQLVPPADAIGVVGKVIDVFQVRFAPLVQPQHIARGGAVIDGLGNVDPAVLAVGDGFRHQIEALIRPVEDHLAEPDVGRILHHLPGDVVP